MDEKQERQLRRKAIRLTLHGVSVSSILRRISRSRRWLCKWRKRFEQFGWAGLRSQSRQPGESPQQYPTRVRRLVVQVRRHLVKRKVGLIGPKAIQRELRCAKLLRRIPSTSTIGRILNQARRIKTGQKPVEAYYPQPKATPRYVLHATDWTERYLEGGSKVFAFHTLDLETRAVAQTLSTDKSHQTAWSHTLKAWKTLGIPDGLQIDNDAAFCGGYKTPRLLGQFVRLCLYVGVEPIFLPVGEPERNGDVERFHELWDQAFWKRRHFRPIRHVQRVSPEFETWYTHVYEPPALDGQTPGQAHRQAHRRRLTTRQIRALPQNLPITAGRVHFIRRVNEEGSISILNETWHASKWLADQYVWTTIVTHKRVLMIYHRRSAESKMRLIKTYKYDLGETEAPLQPDFKHIYRRPKVCTMS